MPFTLESDVAVSSPPYSGDTEVGSTVPRGAFQSYYVRWDCDTTSGGSIAWDIYQVDASNVVVAHDEHNTGTTCHPNFVYTHDFLPTADHVSIVAHLTGAFSDWTGRFRVYYGTDLNFCAYGTEANPDAKYYQFITDSLIDLVVAAALAGGPQAALIPYVETALAAIEGSIFIAIDCSLLPGGVAPLDFPNLSTLSTATLLAWFQSAAWRFFCQCKAAPPGGPAPVPPNAPPIIPPTDFVPVQPFPVCDNEDLCSYLSAMKAQLQSLSAQLSYLRTDVRLIQRQGVPFGYVPGAIHSALSGNGEFPVADILGLALHLEVFPAGHESGSTDPVTYHQLGKLSVGTAAGWRRSWQPTHNPYLIFPIAGAFTRVGYSFVGGVVATITELLRDP